jgi:hypothetical protein
METTPKRRGRPPTKRSKIEAAQALLEGLLRSPKTRNGLIAAVSPGLSKNFVFGWLSDQIRIGKVTVLKTMDPPQYQMTSYVVIEQPRESDFPSWLDPRSVPVGINRQVFIDAKLVHAHQVKGDQQ